MALCDSPINRVYSLYAFCFMLAGCAPSAPPAFESLVREQQARYPAMGAQDWYKLLHQAAMGNRHLGVEDDEIYNYLISELDGVEASNAEPLIESISPDSAVVRLNLRPFKARGGDPDALFAAMKATWETVEPSAELLETYWEALHAVRDLPYSAAELEAFFTARRAEGFPAVHHSEAYEAAYRPAYRVLLRSEVSRLLLNG